MYGRCSALFNVGYEEYERIYDISAGCGRILGLSGDNHLCETRYVSALNLDLSVCSVIFSVNDVLIFAYHIYRASVLLVVVMEEVELGYFRYHNHIIIAGLDGDFVLACYKSCFTDDYRRIRTCLDCVKTRVAYTLRVITPTVYDTLYVTEYAEVVTGGSGHRLDAS